MDIFIISQQKQVCGHCFLKLKDTNITYLTSKFYRADLNLKYVGKDELLNSWFLLMYCGAYNQSVSCYKWRKNLNMCSNSCHNSKRRMCSKRDILRLKMALCLLILSTFVDGSTLDDDSCAIRFYAVRHFQGSYWTFDGNLWRYEENVHKYTEKSAIPDRDIFVTKSIQTLANSPQGCKSWKICSKKYKKTLCKILPSAPQRYPDITNWKIGRHRMKQWRINVMNKRTRHECFGNKCNEIISGKFVIKVLNQWFY